MSPIKRILDYLYDHWTIITFWLSIAATITTYSLTQIFPQLNGSKELFIAFGYSAGISAFFILLEIRKSFKEEKSKHTVFENMTGAQSSIVKTLSSRLKKKSKDPVVLRIYGMRLSGINRILMDFIYKKDKLVWNRDLDIYIYHCDPDFLENMAPHNMAQEKRDEIGTMFKEHSRSLENFVNGLRRIHRSNNRINIYFRKYSSIPSFWAYEIDRTEIFFGYFTWNGHDWIGPENYCTNISNTGQPIRGFVEWINSYIDGLEHWSKPYE